MPGERRQDALDRARALIPLSEARMLMERVLGISRVALMTHADEPLSPADLAVFEQFVARRQAGEPMAYILGEREFYGRVFRVTPDTLIPRPETELLVDLALERLADKAAARVLDLGTGSGAIAVTLALECRECVVTATDLSPGALAVAEENAGRLGARVRFLAGSWFDALPVGEQYDLIVSNPPYVAPGDPHLVQGDVRFEPVSALVGVDDGLGDIRAILAGIRGRLSPSGWLLFEHGYDQGTASRALLEEAGFEWVKTWADLAGLDRVSGGRVIKSAEEHRR